MAANGMSGGGRLDAVLSGIAARLGGPQEVRTGFLEGATEADGQSMPMVAAINEFGAPAAGIPARPFFRGMIAKHKAEWGPELGKVLVNQDYNAEVALGLMGERIGGELRQSIADFDGVPLAPATIAAKSRGGVSKIAGVAGPEKQLINTGDMWKGVASEVRKAGE